MTEQSKEAMWREEFEAFIKSRHISVESAEKYLRKNGDLYLNLETEGCWICYLSACRKRQEEMQYLLDHKGRMDKLFFDQEGVIRKERKEIEKLKAENDALIEDHKLHVESLVTEFNSKVEEISKLKADLEYLKEADTLKELSKIKEENERLSNQYFNYVNESLDVMDRYNKDIVNLESEISKLKEENDEFKKGYKSLYEDHQKLKEDSDNSFNGVLKVSLDRLNEITNLKSLVREAYPWVDALRSYFAQHLRDGQNYKDKVEWLEKAKQYIEVENDSSL